MIIAPFLSGLMVEIAASLHLCVIDFPIDSIGAQQVFMGIETDYLPIVQNKDAVGVLYAADALGNNQFGGTRYLGRKRLADFGIGCSIDSAGGIVKD